MKTGASD